LNDLLPPLSSLGEGQGVRSKEYYGID